MLEKAKEDPTKVTQTQLKGKIGVMNFKGNIISGEDDLCKGFADHFASVYTCNSSKPLNLSSALSAINDLQSAPCVTGGKGEGSHEGVTHSSKSNPRKQ